MHPTLASAPRAGPRAEQQLRRAAVHAVPPVLAGAAIYLLWRSDSLLVFRWVEALGCEAGLDAARSWAGPLAARLPPWIAFSLPDGLWVYALTSAMAAVWCHAPGHLGRRAWVGAAAAAGPAAECLQALGVVPGTFDPADLLACLAGAVACLVHRKPFPSPPGGDPS